jgi:hypothetical protein
MAQQGQLIGAIKAQSGMTVAYSNGGGFWKTRYSFLPSCYGWVDRIMITGRQFLNNGAIVGFYDADLNDDGAIGAADVLALLGAFESIVSPPLDITVNNNSPDVEGSGAVGEVGTTDLLFMLGLFGATNEFLLQQQGVPQNIIDEVSPTTSGPPVFGAPALLWRHDDGAGFNSFYGDQPVASAIAVSFADYPSINKIYKAVSIEGTSNITGSSIFQANSSSQASQLNASSVGPIVERGGINYAHIGRVVKQTTGDALKLVGKIETITSLYDQDEQYGYNEDAFPTALYIEVSPLGGGITFGGGNPGYELAVMTPDGVQNLLAENNIDLLETPDNDINIIPLANNSAYIVTYNPAQTTEAQIVSFFNSNQDSLYLIENSDVAINGDDPKGQYADMLISFGSNDFEVFAVNAEYEAYDLDHRKQPARPAGATTRATRKTKK